MCTMGEAPGPCTREGNVSIECRLFGSSSAHWFWLVVQPSQVAHREPHVAQYFTFTCLALAFSCSWALTLTILCAVPALILIQGVSQALVGPLVVQEQTHTAIATGKSSPLPVQNPCARQDIRRAEPCGEKLHVGMGPSSAFAQFGMMAMFVQGFWIGAHLVHSGQNSAEEVMSVFWECLIATSNPQMCIPAADRSPRASAHSRRLRDSILTWISFTPELLILPY
ncbi:hypothetical protein FIBSPDRAFT_424799 [Athelia psychrophila]|uniref:Uncharacterized protein n=1 Tax=Athelia psychrophila TaxID=1759441 RepID=A0A167UPI2_9AGAM|nr:hypothetical protein FIBSPDRAFT_424799 [Fibularhizoctonia sp. CBS 109695]